MARFGENETTRELFGHLKTIPTTGGDIYSAYQHAMRELERNQPGTRGIESTVQLSDLLCAIEIPADKAVSCPESSNESMTSSGGPEACIRVSRSSARTCAANGS